MAAPQEHQLPILIIGAGIAGLTLAQGLLRSSIPFLIFDRDTHISSRSPGWAVTIHWALSSLQSCLPPNIFAKLKTAQVDPITGANDNGRFLFLDLKTAIPKFLIPPAPRLRLNRRRFREVLSEGVDVKWGKEIVGFKETEDGVVVELKDGSTVKGRLLVGADGANSKTRQILCPETWRLKQLPVRFMGATVRLTNEEVRPLREIDPLLFQGCHPETGTFMWFSILSTPGVNGSAGGEEYFEGQINLSWRVDSDDDENGVPKSNKERLEKMKVLAKPFEERLRTVIANVPNGTEIIEIKLQDWSAVEWPNLNGKVTLIGDAGHAMTMCKIIPLTSIESF